MSDSTSPCCVPVAEFRSTEAARPFVDFVAQVFTSSMDHKKRSLFCAAGADTSVRAVHRLREQILAECREKPDYVDGEETCTRKALARDAMSVATPYGDIVRPTKVGGGVEVHIAHPAALLWHFANVSPDFAEVVRDSSSDINSIAVWSDEVVSGNVLRNDHVNKHVVYFWTSLSWPAYVRFVAVQRGCQRRQRPDARPPNHFNCTHRFGGRSSGARYAAAPL